MTVKTEDNADNEKLIFIFVRIAAFRECIRFPEKGIIEIHFDIPDVTIHCQGNILLQYVPGIRGDGSGLL